MPRPNSEDEGKIRTAMVRVATRRLDAMGRLSAMRAAHMSMAEAYGSELCAGDMEGKEDALRVEIDTHTRHIDLLQLCLAGDLPLEVPTSMRERLAQIPHEIEALRKEEASLTQRWGQIMLAQDLISTVV